MTIIQVLLVEDDITDQMSFKRFVKKEHLPYDYQIASSVAQAIAILDFRLFDVVLADHKLEDGTAFDLFPYIPANTPVVFVTGTGDEEIAVKAMKSGAADYLTKDLHGDYLKLLPSIISNVIKDKNLKTELEAYKQLLEEMVVVRTEQLLEEINHSKEIEARLTEEKERARMTLNAISEAVITTDVHGMIDFVNPMAEKLTGWQFGEVYGQSIDKIFTIVDEKNLKQAINPVHRCLVKDEISDYDHVLLINRNGVQRFIQDSAAPLHDTQGKIQGAVLVFNDETQVRKLTQNLIYQATHNPLAGLVNRQAFEERLNQLLAFLRTSEDSTIFCHLLLEPFKMISNTCGYLASDELLARVTAILQSNIRAYDTLSRLGWGEFGILMEHCPLERALTLATVLREAIANYHFDWQGKSFPLKLNVRTIQLSGNFTSLNDLLPNE